MITRRMLANLVVFLGLTALLVVYVATQLVFQTGTGRTVRFDFTDAAGMSPRDDVTMRGIPVGGVKTVQLLPNGIARITVALQPGVAVPGGSRAEIDRRSPIGDLVLNILPGTGRALASGALIPSRDTTPPPDPEQTIRDLARVLHAVPSQQLGSLVSTLATALRGRAQDLAELSVASGELPARLLQVQAQLRSLIETGPKVLDVLAANAPQLANDITQTRILAEILDQQRYNLVSLSKNGARFLEVAGNIIATEKANIACLVHDLAVFNGTIAEPQNLQALANTLDLNHYFFDAVWIAVQPGPLNLNWFRVHLLLPQQPPGNAYNRPPPDVYPGDACRSIYGPGVGPATQPGPVYLAPGSKLIPGR